MPDSEAWQRASPLARRKGLHYRLIFNYGLLFIVILSLLMTIVFNAVYSLQMRQAANDLEVRALLAANALEDPLSGYANELEAYERHESASDELDEHGEDEEGPGRAEPNSVDALPITEGLQHLADRYSDSDNLWVTIIDVRGDPIVDSQYQVAAMRNQLGAPEVQAVLEHEGRPDIRSSPLTGETYLFAAAPVQIGNRLLGIVRMARPISDVRAPMRSLARQFLLAGIAALILATGLSIWLAGRLVRPIRKVEETALAVASGDLSRTADIRSDDEIGSLARTFDYMVGELSEMMRQQRFFIANASHELRTPLTNIKLRSEALLALDGEDPDLNRRYLQEIDSEAERLGRLATVLLDLSRIERGAPLRPDSPVDVRPILLDTARSMELRMVKSKLELEVDIAEDLPPLTVDAGDLEIVILNLLDNAVKYTPPGGSVRLLAQAESTADGPGVAIAVRDSGTGIPPEDLDHVFEYFYRVDKARSRQDSRSGAGSGAGLGLAIVQRLVTQNGGHVTVSSVENGGTTFTIHFSLTSFG